MTVEFSYICKKLHFYMNGFLGTRMVFWDLRDTFLLNLYRDNVEDSRLDQFLPHLDTVSAWFTTGGQKNIYYVNFETIILDLH